MSTIQYARRGRKKKLFVFMPRVPTNAWMCYSVPGFNAAGKGRTTKVRLMKTSRGVLAIVIAVLTICLAGAVSYISLLGENNRIDDLVNGFFEKVRNGRYDEIPPDLSEEARSQMGLESGQFSDSVFLLELSLLTYYNLLDFDDYSVVMKKTDFWVPFMEDRPIRISISMKPKRKGRSTRMLSLADLVSGPEKDDFIRNLFSVERRNGTWIITDINIKGSAIAKTYASLKQQSHLDRYTGATHNGFVMREFKVRSDEMTSTEKRILLHVLRKAQLLIQKNHEQGS
jgi:hypothetical protein